MDGIIDVKKRVLRFFIIFYKKRVFNAFLFFECFLFSSGEMFYPTKSVKNPTKPAKLLHKRLLSDGFNMSAARLIGHISKYIYICHGLCLHA